MAFRSLVSMPIDAIFGQKSLAILALHERLQPADGRVPFGRNLVETSMRYLQTFRLQFPYPFAAVTMPAHQACIGKCVKVLGDRLTADFGTIAQASDRQWTIPAKPRNDAQPGRVAEGGKYRNRLGQLRLCGATAS